MTAWFHSIPELPAKLLNGRLSLAAIFDRFMASRKGTGVMLTDSQKVSESPRKKILSSDIRKILPRACNSNCYHGYLIIIIVNYAQSSIV